ncbi:hypothetical protein BC940DRAFT_124782 [Gongronella butleri]|nr:hypothetical protein BC940DRAFT_124782 [Gongronella butleri]
MPAPCVWLFDHFFFLQIYVCHRSKTPNPIALSGSGQQRRYAVPRRVLACLCRASMSVQCLPQDPSQMVIEYHWRHNDHPIGDDITLAATAGLRRDHGALEDDDAPSRSVRRRRQHSDNDSDNGSNSDNGSDSAEDDDDDVAPSDDLNNDADEQHDATQQYDSSHHPGHSVANLVSTPLQRQFRRELFRLVEVHMDWASVKDALRLDNFAMNPIITAVQNRITPELPNSIRIKYKHVHYAITKLLAKHTQLAPRLDESLQLWGDKIENQDGHFLYKRMDDVASNMFCFAFVSNWQLQVNWCLFSCNIIFFLMRLFFIHL